MLESAFRTSVHRTLPVEVHRQPMPASMLGTGGTPDTYYDFKRDLWVEYKVFRREDHLPKIIPAESMPTELQELWLTRRFNAGGNACVIVGVKIRGRAQGFVLEAPADWSRPLPREWYEPRLLPAANLAAYIHRRVS